MPFIQLARRSRQLEAAARFLWFDSLSARSKQNKRTGKLNQYIKMKGRLDRNPSDTGKETTRTHQRALKCDIMNPTSGC